MEDQGQDEEWRNNANGGTWQNASRPKAVMQMPPFSSPAGTEDDGEGEFAKRQRIMPGAPSPPPPMAMAIENLGDSNAAWARGVGGKDSSLLTKTCWPEGKGYGGLPPAPPPFAKGMVKGSPALPLSSKFPMPAPPSSLGGLNGGGPPLDMSDQGHMPMDHGPPVPVFLAPATVNIVPVSSKPSQNKQIAMQFIQSSRETQQQMLRDPTVARAILQTLSDAPQPPGNSLANLLNSLAPGMMPPPPPVAAVTSVPGIPLLGPPGVPATMLTLPPTGGLDGSMCQASSWSGLITLARNKGKRLPMRSTLLHGKVQDVEVALRCAASSFGALDITHRVAFEEVAKRTSTASLLSMVPTSPADHAQYEEYAKYFRTKMRAGVAKLDADLSLYVLPPTDDLPVLRDSVYALNPGITPRSNCLLGLVASTTEQLRAADAVPVSKAPRLAAPVPPAPPAAEPVPTVAAAAPAVPGDDEATAAAVESGSQEPSTKDAAAEGDADSGEGGVDVSQKEILDLFSNPELIKLLSDDAPADS